MAEALFRSRFSEADALAALELIRSQAEHVVPAPDVRGIAENHEDDLVLATAVAGNAIHLVTGDRGLLQRDGCPGITLLIPADFRAMLSGKT